MNPFRYPASKGPRFFAAIFLSIGVLGLFPARIPAQNAEASDNDKAALADLREEMPNSNRNCRR